MRTPTPIRIDLDHVPGKMREVARWMLWNYEERDGESTKVPYQARRPRDLASSTDPLTWATFEEARTAYEDGKADGVGFALGDGWAGVDLDKCRDPESGTIKLEAEAIIKPINSYSEISPSGTGVKIVCLGSLPPGRRRVGTVEMYDSGRYFATTGCHVPGTPTTVEERTTELAALHARLFGRNGDGRTGSSKSAAPVSEDDAALLERARRAKNGDRFSRLWAGDTSGHTSPSEADLALCSHLAFWTARDAARMDRLFRLSGLMRPKWDQRHGAQMYGAMTIEKAITGCQETYSDPSDTRVMVEHLTDAGNARRFAAQHGRIVRYCYPWKSWWTWDGRRWVRDDSGVIIRLAKATVQGIYAEGSRVEDEEIRKALAKHAVRSEADGRIQAMLSLAQSEPGIPVAPSDFDPDPWLLTVQNGTINLRTGTSGPHDPTHLITKIISTHYDVMATAPTWTAFLDRIFAENAGLIRYIQEAVGYSLTGSTKEQTWFLLHGSGANGKTTFLKTITDMLGTDYATWTPPQTLLAKRGERIDNDLARLRGARMVAAVETEGGRRLAEALVKQLTGGDKVTARFLFSEFFEFTPQFKLWLATNHKPEIRGTDHAVWRRIRLIPFAVTIPDEEQDKDLLEKLRGEFPGILRWAVEGCLAWQRGGLGLPDAVREATAEYRASMDVIAEFLEECCQKDATKKASARSLYGAYVKWCGKEQPESQRRFGESLSEKGYVRTRGNRGEVVWSGLGLISEGSEGSEPLFGKVPL